VRAVATLVVAGAVVWSVALVAGPLLRPDLDPLTTHPETYAQGPWAPVMRFGYVAIAFAGAAAAWLARRHGAPALLLAAFATGAIVIGLLPPTGGDTIADRVFPIAQLAPLAFFPAIALISWRERRPALMVLTALVIVLFLPLAFGEPPFGGLLNRAADLAMAGWLSWFARPLLDVQAGAAPSPPSIRR
jgi:hypothetical protein